MGRDRGGAATKHTSAGEGNKGSMKGERDDAVKKRRGCGAVVGRWPKTGRREEELGVKERK